MAEARTLTPQQRRMREIRAEKQRAGDARQQNFKLLREAVRDAKAELQRSRRAANGIPATERSVSDPKAALESIVGEMDRIYGGLGPSSSDDARLAEYRRQASSALERVRVLANQVVDAAEAYKARLRGRQESNIGKAAAAFGAGTMAKAAAARKRGEFQIPRTKIETHKAANGRFCSRTKIKTNGEPAVQRCGSKPARVVIDRAPFKTKPCRTKDGTFGRQGVNGGCARAKTAKKAKGRAAR